MSNKSNYPEASSGFQYEKHNLTSNEFINEKEMKGLAGNRDDDLIIEENTIYEIDRECYERLKKLKKRK